MRLFSAGTFYLSRSSSLSAEWLCDRDTIQQHRNTGVLLSTVIQMQTLERDTLLYPPDPSIYADCYDICDWLHASAFNLAWMVDYFNTLDSKCARLFQTNPLTWQFKRALTSYLDVFDNCDTTESWLPLTPSEARASYAQDVKKYQYRKVRMPFWLNLPNTKAPNVARLEPEPLPELDLTPLW